MGNPLPERLWKCEAGECTQQTTPADDQFRTYEECKLQCPELTGCSLCTATKGVVWKTEGLAFCDTLCYWSSYYSRYYRFYNVPLINFSFYVPHYTTWRSGGHTFCMYRRDIKPIKTLDAAAWLPPSHCNGLPWAASHYERIRFEATLSDQYTPTRWLQVFITAISDHDPFRLVFFYKNALAGPACNATTVIANTVGCALPCSGSSIEGGWSGLGVSRAGTGTVTLKLVT